MPAKMLNALSDEMPEFERQVGCMAGIFQIFDRHRLLTGRRRGRHGRKRPPPANALSNSSSNLGVQNSSTPKITLEKTFSKSMTENSSLSMESSRASCSSSSCSSFSSLDGNKSIQQELPYINEELFVEKPLKSSPRLKNSPTETRPGHPHVEFRDIVKDSINRDSRGLTVKTSAREETRRNGLYKDSPRPLLLSKSVDGTYVIGIDRSTKVPADVLESSRSLRERSRLSCDDRQLLRPAEAQDGKRPSAKLRELPRLSLDSRKESLSPSSRLKNLGYSRTDDTLLDALKPQESPSHRRSSSVIAKLMGLEETPHFTGAAMTDSYEPTRSPRPVQDAKDERLSRSPRSSCRDTGVSQSKNQSSVLKTKPSPRVLTEAAPWRQQDRGATNSAACECRDAEVRPRTASIYADLERRLQGIEFLECNKDLRALRILGALHAKDVRHDGQSGNQTARRTDSDARSVPAQKKEAVSRNFQSPVVLIKPARTSNKPDVSLASVAPLAGLRSLRKLRPRDPSPTGKAESNVHDKIHSRIPRAHSRADEPASSANSPRTPRSPSPGLVKKKVDSETRSRPPVSPMSPNRKSNEAVSPRSRPRSRASQARSSHDDEVPRIPEGKIILAKQVDVSIMDRQKPLDVEPSFDQQSHAASMLNHEEPSSILGDHSSDKKIHPLENVPSPVSVLDASLYHDGSSPSLKRISDSFKDGETHTSDECWNPISLPHTPPSKTSSEGNQMKLENLEALCQKLQLLESADDEAPNSNDTVSLVTQSEDHQYIYEILSASGLLHQDLSFTPMPGQLRSSAYPINPELFLILELTKSDLASAPQAKLSTGKLHRRLIFDLANEIVAQKIDFPGSSSCSLQFLQSRKLSGWQLFKDLCADVDGLQAESSRARNSEETDDENLLSGEDALRQMKEWKSFDSELQGMVLDVERSIFKDLIDEVIDGEVGETAQLRQRKLRRQLSFSSII